MRSSGDWQNLTIFPLRDGRGAPWGAPARAARPPGRGLPLCEPRLVLKLSLAGSFSRRFFQASVCVCVCVLSDPGKYQQHLMHGGGLSAVPPAPLALCAACPWRGAAEHTQEGGRGGAGQGRIARAARG